MSDYPVSDKMIRNRRFHKNLTFLADYENTKSLYPRFARGNKLPVYLASRDVTHPSTYIDENGKLQIITSSNTPRFTNGYYDQNGFSFAKGLLTEPQATNLLMNGTFDNNVTIDIPANTTPIRYNSTQRWLAYAYTANGANIETSLSSDSCYMKSIKIKINNGGSGSGDIQLSQSNSFSLTLNQKYTISFWIKTSLAKSNLRVMIMKNNTPYTNYGLDYYFSTPANKWVRIQRSFTANTTVSDAMVDFHFGGIGTFDINIDSLQAETGSFASSFIPTTAGSLTRNGDILYYDILNNMPLGESTIYFNVVPFYEADNAGWMPHIMSLFFCNGGQGRWIWLGSQNGRQLIFKPNGEASPNCYSQDYSLDWNPYDNIKLTCRCKHTSPYVSLFKNNVKSVYDENDDNFDDIPAYAPNFFIGNATYTTTNHFLGIIKQAAIFDRALSDSEILNIVNNGLRVSA